MICLLKAFIFIYQPDKDRGRYSHQMLSLAMPLTGVVLLLRHCMLIRILYKAFISLKLIIIKIFPYKKLYFISYYLLYFQVTTAQQGRVQLLQLTVSQATIVRSEVTRWCCAGLEATKIKPLMIHARPVLQVRACNSPFQGMCCVFPVNPF